MRLDQAIAARYPEVSRRKARELLAAHRVLVNERPVSVSSREVGENDRIVIVEELPELVLLTKRLDLIAVDKPAGLAVQPSRDRGERSLIELLQLQLKQDDEPHELFLVHRIDVPTSGVVLFARTRDAAARLSALFAGGEIVKRYLAVAGGMISEELTIETPIEAKSAKSIVRPLASNGSLTLVETRIETGRTHQIRIHLSGLGHPVAGDRRYGGTGAPRLMLHAWSIAHPSFGELIAPPPASFASWCTARGLAMPAPRA